MLYAQLMSAKLQQKPGSRKTYGVTIDDAFRDLMQHTGWPADQVVYALAEALLASRAKATCRRFRDGKLESVGQVRPDFWRDRLALQ